MTSQPMTKRAGGCDCVGAPTPAANGGCCKECCDLCDEQGYVRPHFFAGQLLTEEDLGQLSDYVVRKNRLHNRHLWGDGVVCGLEVKPHPCGGGKVIVEPGYALDCCGNDIVLPCSKTLDINAMVRKLREKMLGHDCGDPCQEAKQPQAGEPLPKAEVALAGKVSAALHQPVGAVAGVESTQPSVQPTATPQPPERGRRYGLYIFYCEQKTDPVAPYSTGDSCGAQACVETRIREGFGFDLRCCEEPVTPPNLYSRMCDCLKEVAERERTAPEIKVLDRQAPYIKAAIQALETGAPAFEKAHLAKAVEDLKVVLPIGVPTPLAPELADRLLESTRATASHTARYYATDPEKRPADAATEVSTAHELLARAKAFFETPQGVKSLEPMSESNRAFAAAVLESAGRMAQPLEAEASKRAEVTALAGGLAYTRELEDRLVKSVEVVRDDLLAERYPAVKLTPVWRARLAQVRRAALPPEKEAALTANRLKQLRDNTQVVLNAKLQNAVKCVCGALNPPCQPCEDLGVRLACIEVKDCEVVDVCNLERKWVITPVALRYWIPHLHWLGEAWEVECCENLGPSSGAGKAKLRARGKTQLPDTPGFRALTQLIGGEILALAALCLGADGDDRRRLVQSFLSRRGEGRLLVADPRFVSKAGSVEAGLPESAVLRELVGDAGVVTPVEETPAKPRPRGRVKKPGGEK